MRLRDSQTAMAAALLSGDDAAASSIRAGKLPAARRLEIYRHNVYSNLRGVLKDIYPVILAIVGEDYFMHAASQFVNTHPSRSGDLNQFGAEWAAFLSSYPHAADLPYLPDVARLEWAWHEAFHAADGLPLDLARLAVLAPEEHGAMCFTLHPTVRLVQSSFPILRIWEVNQPTYTGEIEVHWDAPPESLLIHRDISDEVSVLIERIPAAGHAFLSAIMRRTPLDAASVIALDEDAAFDLQGFLIDSVQSGVIVDFKRG